MIPQFGSGEVLRQIIQIQALAMPRPLELGTMLYIQMLCGERFAYRLKPDV